MSDGTREIIRICEQLPEAQRLQVEHYARSLLPRTQATPPPARVGEKPFRDITPLRVGGVPASEMLIRDRR